MVASNKLRSMLELKGRDILINIGYHPDDGFNLIMLEAVDEALSFLGESAKRAFYYHLEEKFKIRREEIPIKKMILPKPSRKCLEWALK